MRSRAGHRHRVYDAVVLKTLGATRRQLITAYALEYLLVGLATVAFGVAAGSLAAWRIVVDVMTLPFAWEPAPAVAAALLALVITMSCGLIGTFAALGENRRPCCEIYDKFISAPAGDLRQSAAPHAGKCHFVATNRRHTQAEAGGPARVPDTSLPVVARICLAFATISLAGRGSYRHV